ncbi:hypothetical protein BE20_30750 [Sorangium cellulosum]|uniref:Uncharacterized protein n=1 Tax=Sorangium cellulosum TaxID=56 RepID=A0A150T4U5_SORCE|nr:hypothetical protein BE20_30750 [Sorangium cellulosum]KYG02639.1 hypothetical protein BE18_48150 [Sorangium cellulosum]
MAADKPVKRKRKGSGSTGQGGEVLLRQRTDPRSERRFEPKASLELALTLLGMSVAALLAGAGVYGQWFRGEEAGAHPAAPYLLVGALLLGAAAGLFGQWSMKPVRVGDAGVALENGPGEIERIGWSEVTGLLLSESALTVQGGGTVIAIPLRAHLAAASRVLSEARKRIPGRVADIKEDALPAPDDAAGEVRPLEPPQVAGLHCKATDKLIAFEADARLCGRCGELYHKDGVPPRCVTCEAPLR